MEEKDYFIDYLKEIPNYLSIFIFPIFFMTAGPMLIEMGSSIGTSPGDLSLIFTFFTTGSIVGQLTSVLYNRKFRKIWIVIGSYIIIFLLLILLSFSRNLYLLYILYLFVGYFAGVIWMQATKDILENKIKNKDRITTVLLTFYPIGNFTAPFIASTLINNKINWRYSYYIMAFIVVVIVILYIILKRSRKDKEGIEQEEKLGLREIFIDRRTNMIFILGVVLLFFYCISETVIATWSPTFLRSERMFDIQAAGLVVSIFWLAILIGRIIVSFLAGKFKSNYIILVLSIIAFISMVLLIFLRTRYAIFISVAFAGLGCSGIITLGISAASTIYEKGRGILASIVFAFANLAISITPFITRYTSNYNITLSIALASAFMILTTLVILMKIIYENKTIGNKGKL